jgi:putative heme-binding domain-containing protein
MEGFVVQIKDDALAILTNPQEVEMASILAEQQQSEIVEPLAENRPFVRAWKVDELIDSTSEAAITRDNARGKQIFTEASCVRCHRLRDQGRPVGPDLTAVSSRFTRRDLLESIISPSKVVAENYRQDVIETTDGRVFVGSVVVAGDYRSPTLRISTDPLVPGKVVDIAKSGIASHEKSFVSQMPEGLLNTFSKDEILDLLAYIERGGAP